jgi:hypothetical protein
LSANANKEDLGGERRKGGIVAAIILGDKGNCVLEKEAEPPMEKEFSKLEKR